MEQRRNGLADTSEVAILQNWLELNKRMAEQQREVARRKQEEIESNIRVHDLKKVWEKFYG